MNTLYIRRVRRKKERREHIPGGKVWSEKVVAVVSDLQRRSHHRRTVIGSLPISHQLIINFAIDAQHDHCGITNYVPVRYECFIGPTNSKQLSLH